MLVVQKVVVEREEEERKKEEEVEERKKEEDGARVRKSQCRDPFCERAGGGRQNEGGGRGRIVF